MNNLLLRICRMNGWRYVAGTAALALLVVAGCGKREAGQEAHAERTTPRNVTTGAARSVRSGVAVQTTDVGVALAAFDTGLHAEEILTALISRDTTNGLDFESVSNAVAGIDSETIIRFGRTHLESRIYDNPRTMAIAQMYEVVLARGDVPSARLVALLELHHMYGGINSGRVPLEWFQEKDRLFEEARLSAHPTDAERTAFATIQVAMLTGHEEPEQKLARLQRVKEMCARGDINLSQQIRDMNESSEIIALLELKRADEAYKMMKESFAKRDRGELDPSVWPGYGDFESAFHSFSNSYYGDPIGKLMKLVNEGKIKHNWDASIKQ